MSITDPDTVHIAIAAGAADVATLIDQHAQRPPLARCEIEWDHAQAAPRLRCQLFPSAHDLANVVAWADALEVDTVAATRHETPNAFTGVSVHGTFGGSGVQVWTHPNALEVAALWDAVGDVPEPLVTATLSLRSVRGAADLAAERAPVAAADEGAT